MKWKGLRFMKKFQIGNKGFSLMRKITIAYVIFVFIPLITIAAYSYIQYGKQAQEKLKNNQIGSLTSNIRIVNSNIKSMSDIAQNLSYNSSLQTFLESEYSPNSYNLYHDVIFPVVNSVKMIGKINILNVRVYITNKSIPNGWGIFYREKDINNEKWYTDFKDSKQTSLWMASNIIDNARLVSAGSKNEQMTYSRKIYSVSSDEYLGIIAITVDQSELFGNGVYSQIVPSFVAAYNNEGENIFLGMNQLMQHEKIERYKGGNGEVRNGFLYISEKLEGLNMELVAGAKLINPLNKWTLTGAFAVAILLITLLISVFYIFLRYIFFNINSNIKEVHRIIENDFIGRLPVNGDDEIARIASNFNTIIDKVDLLLIEMVKKETAQKNAQLMALQYQINPHFLYNTIEIFKMKMEMEGKYEVADSMGSFGSMLRYNINNKTIFSNFEAEIKHVEDYMSIQKIRYGQEVINLSFDLPVELKCHKIIKFVLQPLVENSIKHGIKRGNLTLNIIISFRKFGNYIYIYEADNGKGIPLAKLNQLNSGFRDSDYQNNDLEKNRIGMENTNERLKLFYGNDSLLQIDSKENYYTKLYFKIPYEGDENV